MEESSELVKLEIEGNLVECNRNDLINNSDYFKAMLEGNFVESNLEKIPLNGIELESMNVILKLLWDRDYPIDDDKIFGVLQAASMLQFTQILDICIKRLFEMLSIDNCLKIWLYTEHLGLKSIYLKAKLFALMEFMSVKECTYFLELNLDEVVKYLGNVYLFSFDEIEVFYALIKWHRNSGGDNLGKLICCLDFTRLSEQQIEEILNFKDVKANQNVVDGIKNGHFKSICRNLEGFPCMFVGSAGEHVEELELSECCNRDTYRRKRRYMTVEETPGTTLSIIACPEMDIPFLKFFYMDPRVLSNLSGFKIIGYKQFVYLYGGEHTLGKGDWNSNFVKYDVINEKWINQGHMPFVRRHFESCTSGGYFFIVGGTGAFRILQENMFWYNFETNEWSQQVVLPCSSRQIKCCCFQRLLFILNINDKCGYRFNPEKNQWSRVDICDYDAVLPQYSTKLKVFGYGNNLYIKDGKMCKLKLQGKRLIVERTILPKTKGEVMDSVLCGKVLYSLIDPSSKETAKHVLLLESVKLDDFSSSIKEIDENFVVDNEIFKFNLGLTMYSAFHYSFLDNY